MTRISAFAIPAGSLLGRYVATHGFADAYVTTTPQRVSHAQFVAAFYTTRLFKVERWLLAAFASKPSTDEDAHRLAEGRQDTFAAWRVEARGRDELLVCDFLGNTRSWLKVEVVETGTRLYFGSAVVAKQRSGREPSMGWIFHALLGFHRLYSKALLRAACSRLDTLNR